METSLIDTLAERIESLERENRRWKRVGAFALAGSIALLILGAKGADGPKVVEAERFVLRDQEGRERGGLRVNSAGTASLSVEGREGHGGVSLVTSVDGSASYVDVWSGTQGHVKLSVRENTLALDILDKDRKGLMSLRVDNVNGDPAQKRAGPPVPGGRTQYLSFGEDAGQVNLGLHKDGSGGLTISRDAGGRRTELWQQAQHADHAPILRIYNEEGKPIVQIPPP